MASTSPAATSANASSRSPASYLACAADSARSARRDESAVRAVARSRNAEAAAKPPRARARSAARSSSAATSSSGPGVASAGATRADRDPHGHRSRSPVPGAPRAFPRSMLSDTPPNGSADDETGPAPRPPADRRSPGPNSACDPKLLSRAQQQGGIPGRLRSRDQQEPAGVVRQRVEAAQEALLDPARQRQGASHPEAARQLCCRYSPRQLR